MRHLTYLILLLPCLAEAKISARRRQKVVQAYNPRRNASSDSTPLRVPTTPNQTSIDDFTGLQWWTHDRLVSYTQHNPVQNDISQWLIQNPQRINLGNIGFTFPDRVLRSSFVYKGVPVSVKTAVDPDSDTVLMEVDSRLLQPRSPGGDGGLGLFFDFPFSDRNKCDAPFLGVWNATDKHMTVLQRQTSPYSAVIQHSFGQTTYFLTLKWEGGEGKVTGPAEGTHRRLRLTATFSPEPLELDATTNASISTTMTASFTRLPARTQIWWNTYWITGAFVNLPRVIRSKSSSSPTSTNITTSATELQRRILLSLYLLAVNHASSLPPQESGLVNNGYRDIRETRWGKMTDPTGRSAPGEINSLLIWQQPHPMFFAETEWRGFPNGITLEKWDEVITATGDFMASYAWFNELTGYYDLRPPMYPVSENTNPNNTINPTFELAYWRFGLDVACRWRQRQNKTAPESWTRVRDNLAPLPVVDVTYAIYEGIPDMWTDNKTTNDHPAMAGIYGLLPPLASGPSLDMGVLKKMAENIKRYWALEESYGWDFSMLAMNALRLGDAKQAVEYLLHPIFQFDDAGYPVGGSRVPTPYFPNSASLLLAVAMMAGGWDGNEGKRFPEGWEGVEVDGFVPAM
ncbi:Six-hairpin glycosidase-like protein [Pseudoneurospora amorphoporcata]|uniref:Six-hairpin glycosidase-like protein n=1 Tax=Pseudoneurospora amorphoporcata TaxID=241081 RepID=A0AAN6SEM0_9PEZI|nr:Six-hairpin glycosidase-like protein [Pseudoneurospora amorphoporcata]